MTTALAIVRSCRFSITPNLWYIYRPKWKEFALFATRILTAPATSALLGQHKCLPWMHACAVSVQFGRARPAGVEARVTTTLGQVKGQ